MNYYRALEIQDPVTKKGTGKFQYTRRNDSIVTPYGYCYENGCKHNSEEDAQKCYVKYQLDNYLILEGSTGDTYRPCKVCKKLTNKVATVGSMGNVFHLCDNHRTREFVEKYFTYETVAYIISSC